MTEDETKLVMDEQQPEEQAAVTEDQLPPTEEEPVPAEEQPALVEEGDIQLPATEAEPEAMDVEPAPADEEDSSPEPTMAVNEETMMIDEEQPTPVEEDEPVVVEDEQPKSEETVAPDMPTEESVVMVEQETMDEPVPSDEPEPVDLEKEVAPTPVVVEEETPLVEEETPLAEEEKPVPEEWTPAGWVPMKQENVEPKKEEMVAMGVHPVKKHLDESEVGEETAKLASGWTQVKALMEKNALTKVRTPGATMAEMFSPVLLMLVLWISYNLSEIVTYKAKYFHSMDLDLPFFWDSGYYETADEMEDIDLGDSHRRGLMTDMNGNTLDEVQEEDGWTWAKLLDGAMDGAAEPEDMGLVTDLLMANHLRRNLHSHDDLLMMEDSMVETEGLHDDAVMLVEEDADSGDWYEEIWADIKKETVDKIDWEQVEEEIKDNFGDLWNEAKDYISYYTGSSTSRKLDNMRRRLNKFMKGPVVVPTFSQYVWASKLLSSFLNVQRNIPYILQDSSYGRQWGNLLTLGTIHLSPQDHPMTQKFINYLERTYPAATAALVIRTHVDHDEAMEYVMENLDNERTWAVIDLNELADGSDETKGGSYTIRLNYTTVPNTALVENYVAIGLSTRYQRYYLSGYLTLQRAINDFVMDESGCEAHVDPFFSMPMPTAAYEQNVFFLHVGYLLGLVLVMAFLYPTSRLIQSLVEERETRMKETLLILGVRPWAHTTSWVLTSALSFVFIAMMMSVVLKHILLHTSFALIWFWLALFGMSSMAFCFFLASFFSKAKLAAVVGPMALFASLLPRFVFFGTNRYEATGAKMAASILPGVALAFGADIVGDYEYGEQSVGDHIWVGDYSFGTSLFFLIFDTFLYMALAWYTEQVVPREYGAAPKPWYFPFLWFFPRSVVSRFSSDKTLAESVSEDDLSVGSLEKAKDVDDCVEPVNDPALKPRVFINDLVKIYNKKQSKPSVNHLNLTLYESQITALLGHNGAGKTSTVSVLTGLFPPTSGDATIYGHSVVEELAKARQSIGICPQHNVLFDRLTVMEHMRFFSKIKGVSFEIQDLKDKALELGLTEDQLRTTAGALSGGNKRKLSVAIALCGNPKFLILDEPTSAMDPTARRRTWQVLRKKRAGRVTLLTTHFMDEAEHLSDRVAVVKQGELQCCGSPLYLKDKYNLGWNLTVVMEKPEEAESADDEYSGCQSRITSFLQGFIPQAELVRRSGRELTFCFPKGTEDLFPAAFDAFEQQAEDLGASSYGIENASFEEVFLLLAEKEENDAGDKKDDDVSLAETGSVQTDDVSRSSISISDNESVVSSKFSAVSGDTEDSDGSVLASSPKKVDTLKLKDTESYKGMNALCQIGLLYWKRVTVQKRDVKGAFFAVILPVLLVALVVLVLNTNIAVAGPPKEMSPGLYKNSYSVSSEASTQVLIGGGAYAQDRSNVQTEYLFMDSGMGYDYPNAEFSRFTEGASTQELSHYLLDTYNDHDHPTRFGAYSLDGGVPLNVNINFTAFQNQIDWYMSRQKSHGSIKLRDQRVDIMEVLGIAGRNGRVYWRMDVDELAESFYSWSNVNPHARIRTAELHNLTREALSGILETSNVDLAEMRAEYEADIRAFASMLSGNVTEFLRSRQIRELKTNVTDMYAEFVDEAGKILNNTEQIEKQLEAAIRDFLDVGFKEIERSQKDKMLKRVVFRWSGDMKTAARDFVNDLAGLGEDPEKDTLSIYGLGERFYHKMKQLVDDNMVDITGLNYTVESIEDAILSTFKGDYGDKFNRDAIVREFSAMADGLAKLYGHEDLNSQDTIQSVAEWVDARLLDYSDGAISKIPGQVFVAPLIFMDYVLGLGDYETITPDEAFGYLSEALGGSRNKKNGFISFRAKDIVVDFGRLAIDLNNIYVTTGHGTQVEIDNEYSFRFTLDSLKDLVPKNTTVLQFQFDLPSKTSLLHNSSSPHAVAAFNQAYMEHRYKQCLGDVRSSARLVSVNHPLPLTAKQSLEIKVMLSVLAGLFILIPFCYIPATFIVFLVKERISKSKHLQLVSGVNMSAYWIATYLWDLTLYLILTFCILIVLFCYGDNAQVFIGNKEAVFCTFALTFGYGVSALPFSYVLSRFFSNSSTAQISVAGIGWLTGFVTVISYVTMWSMEKTRHIAEALQPWFRLFPAYNVGEGFMNMSTSFWEREILGMERYPLDWDVAGHSIAYVFLLSLPYFFLVLALEYAADGGAGGYLGRGLRAISYYWTKLMLSWHGIRMSAAEEDGAHYSLLGDDGSKRNDDEDVAREREYVMKNSDELRQTAPVVLKNIWKIYPPSVGILGSFFMKMKSFILSIVCYPCRKSTVLAVDDGDERKSFVPKQAVRGVSTAINKGETYALLGANGAGKTTTMGMLTGDITSTNGSAYIAGHNATGGSNNGVAEARRNIGFCPQKDPLLDLMTGRETLTMFARLRGVPAKEVKPLVDELLDRLTLTPHADKVTKAYSGGNKRKLSLGLALIGDPKVLLIDESSSGLDPLAKRKMWDLIEEAARSRSVILTTHSMQEAEALCTRVAIMVKGQFVCLGSVQHLKSKYLDGYSVDMFCKSSARDADVDRVVNEVLQALPGCSLSERHGRFMRFEVSNVSSLGLGTCFRRLQELKNDSSLFVENYSVSQCSLEHVFVKLVNTDDNNPRNDDLEHGAAFATTL